MKYDFLYSSINFTGDDSFLGLDDQAEQHSIVEIENLSKVNILIGANNAGKSRFLRSLMRTFNKSELNVSYRHDSIDWSLEGPEYRNYVKDLRTKTPDTFFSKVAGMHQFLVRSKQIQEIKFLGSISISRDELIFPKDYCYIPTLRGLHDIRPQDFFSEGPNYHLMNAGKSGGNLDYLTDNGFFRKNDAYLQYFWKSHIDELVGNTPGNKVFTGQNLYSEIKRKMLGSEFDRNEIREFESFLSNTFFAGQSVELLPTELKNDSRIVQIKIGDAPQYPIHKVGDGIQQLIILLYPLFTRQSTVFMIDEPENSLHPGFQRRFMNTLINNKFLKEKNHQYFITTHSNHFLDLTIEHKDISIFKFKSIAENKKLIEQVESGDESLLAEIGVQNSSVFMANKVLWVEGITDRLYMSAFIDAYQNSNVFQAEMPQQRKLYSDIDYVIAEYAGSNGKHFFDPDMLVDEKISVERLCSKSIILADMDFNKDNKHKRYEKAYIDRYIALEVREVENLLSPEQIYSALLAYTRKTKNILITEDVLNSKKFNYKDKYIGTYIDKHFLDPKKNTKKVSFAKFKRASTLKTRDKMMICRHVINGLNWDNMSTEAQNATRQVYNQLI